MCVCVYIYEIISFHVIFTGMCLLLQEHCLYICNIKTAAVLDAGKFSYVTIHYEK
jgi:hypothetical protein